MGAACGQLAARSVVASQKQADTAREREGERERARQRGVSESPVTALFGTPNMSEGPIG